MTRTGIKATEAEITELKDLLESARRTPVMALSVDDGMAGRDFASTARQNMLQRCHALALAHGLPEITGYYGADLETGEFVSA